MRTMRTSQAGRAVDIPLPATQSCSEWRLDNPIVSYARRRHKDRRRHAPRDAYLASLAPQSIRQTRAALGDTPERLFGPQKGMGQMPRREPLTKAPGRPGRSLQAHPSHPRPPSLLRVVPFAPSAVKGMASNDAGRAAGDEILPGPRTVMGWSHGARLLPCCLHLYRAHQGCRGGAR